MNKQYSKSARISQEASFFSPWPGVKLEAKMKKNEKKIFLVSLRHGEQYMCCAWQIGSRSAADVAFEYHPNDFWESYLVNQRTSSPAPLPGLYSPGGSLCGGGGVWGGSDKVWLTTNTKTTLFRNNNSPYFPRTWFCPPVSPCLSSFTYSLSLTRSPWLTTATYSSTTTYRISIT